MQYDVSMVKRGDWRIGIVFGAEYVTTVRSADEQKAIKAAQEKRRRVQSTRFIGGVDGRANIDPTWQFCQPDELVPAGRQVAQALGTTFFVGRECQRHPLNHVRYTANRCCAICEAERQKGLKR